MEVVMKIGEIIAYTIASIVGLSMIITLIDLYFAYAKYLKVKMILKTEKMVKDVTDSAINEIVKFQVEQIKNDKK